MGKRILIVDDSSMMRKMLKVKLLSMGHTIAGEAKDGLEAITMYKEIKPDVVSMDITMRGMNGFAAAKEILDYDKKAAIIFLSNLSEDKYDSETKKIGAYGFINKHKVEDILKLIEDIE